MEAKVVDDDLPWPDGTRETILAPEDEGCTLSLRSAEKAALLERIRDADRGDVVDGDELLRDLDE